MLCGPDYGPVRLTNGSGSSRGFPSRAAFAERPLNFQRDNKELDARSKDPKNFRFEVPASRHLDPAPGWKQRR